MKSIADLFCGAGGTSTGILSACADLGHRADLLAVNHWTTAIRTHSLNHPGVRHLCESLDNIRPVEAVPGGRLNLLAASPECTHHSVAAGGRPKNDQSRATAWHVCRWAADLSVENIMIENVREFQNWGPLGVTGKPLKRRKGETFQAFIQALRSMGFNVEYRVVNAADFGDPTSRRRLIIMGRRGKPIVWPEASHGTAAQPWRTAREIIDWERKGQSIFRRKKPLSANTLRRIAAGLRKFGGQNAEPFLVMLYGTNDVRTVDLPTPTVTSGGQHIALAEPFITHITHHGERASHSIDKPVPTITTAHRGELALVEPFITSYHAGETKNNDNRNVAVSDPLPTQDTSNRFALVEPFICKYYGTGGARSLQEPLDTVTTKDRFLLVEPKTGRAVAELDILFRMLQPEELAAAMSFPKDYQFTGNRGDQVKQIGNAVPVQLARAHAKALLS